MEDNMKEKKTVLIRTYHLIEVDEEELYKEDGLLDKIEKEISKDIELSIGESVHMKWEGTSMTSLTPEIMNCGKCSCCGAWVTDREKADHIEGLCNGATVDGELLCDECLPEDHKWSF
jgi:hypothetical protein